MENTWVKKLTGPYGYIGKLMGCVLLVGAAVWSMHATSAFNGRDMVVLNVVVPVVQAGFRAHRQKKPVGSAILQAIAGGLMMQKAFEMVAETNDQSFLKAWKSKILLNFGASMCESAGGEFQYRMDIGPIWFFANANGTRFRPGLHSSIAPLLNMDDGARVDWRRSLKFGTAMFTRPKKSNGTIGSDGALAYSNANNIITDFEGSHVGHELVHTFQYRRDVLTIPGLTSFGSTLSRFFGDRFVDDSGWSIDWGLQSLWSDMKFQNRDFDIPMEKEAYYLSDHR